MSEIFSLLETAILNAGLLEAAQVFITVLSLVSMHLINSKSDKTRRWGPVIGLISQPAWLYMQYKSGLWIMFITSVFYTFQWMRGVWNYWYVKSD